MNKWIPPTVGEIEEIRAAEEAMTEDRKREDERRRSTRLGLHANVTACSETNFFTGFTMDLSEGGVFIATYSPPPVGDRVALNITVAGEMELVVQGIVRWHRTEEGGGAIGCGVQFTSLDDRQQQALSAMLDRAQREPLLFEA